MRRRTSSGALTTSKPSTSTRPPLGRATVVMMRSVVVLPAPFGPSRPKIDPCCTENDRSSTARIGRPRAANVFTRLFTTMAGVDTNISVSPSCGSQREWRSGRHTCRIGGQEGKELAAFSGRTDSRQRFPVQREQTAPCLFGLRLVVDARIRRTPAVRGAGVDFDFRRQVRLAERLLQHVLLVGRTRVIVLRDLDQELRLGLRRLQMRTVRRIGDESAAME